LLALALWFTYRIDGLRAAVASGPVESAERSLRERLARGEINADEYRRLRALMHLTD
jgi:uncharacterized membrane protein